MPTSSGHLAVSSMMASEKFAESPLIRERQAHKHERSSDSWRRLSLVLLLTALYMFAELLGGWWTGSLALLADAGHMFTDVAALMLALTSVWFGSRPATPRKTFGYYRLEIIAALVNGVALVVISVGLLPDAQAQSFGFYVHTHGSTASQDPGAATSARRFICRLTERRSAAGRAPTASRSTRAVVPVRSTATAGYPVALASHSGGHRSNRRRYSISKPSSSSMCEPHAAKPSDCAMAVEARFCGEIERKKQH